MLTREQILEVDTYCAEHQVSQQRYLDEHNIPRHQYYVWKRKYRQEDEQSSEHGAFVQLRPGGEFVSPMMPQDVVVRGFIIDSVTGELSEIS